MKVLLATEKPFAQPAVDGIKEVIATAGYELVILEKYTSKQALLDAVADANAIIIRSDIIDAEVIAAAKELKIVVRAGAGFDNVDLDAATKAGVCVMNTPGQNANAVAELALGLMIYGVRNLYNGTAGTEIAGKTLGLQAYGHIGKNVARLAKGFGMNVTAYDPFCRADKMTEDGVTTTCSLPEFYEKSQFVSLHIPVTEVTRNSINYDLLSRMPKGALLLNTARKEIINEAELMQVMEEREDFRYITDIKPALHDEFAKKFPTRYFATPKKMGAQTAEANVNAGLAAANQIVYFIKEGVDTFRVNK